MDVRFKVQDLFEKIRPNTKVHETLQEAADALNEIVARYTKPVGSAGSTGDVSDGTSEKSDDEQEDQREPIDEEPEDEEGKMEEMDVSTLSSHC